jgi:probable F420-dependent oxidoreductase
MLSIGVIYPHNEIETRRSAVQEYAEAVEAMGYSHVVAYDHVLGANTASRPDWKGPYNLESPFHEPLVMFSFMAAATRKLGFFTGILILPQRQAVLVAKQAASLDVLCEGRLRIGVGTGWNQVEYEALGVSYAGRGERLEEQVEVMRKLWSQPAVTVRTPDHTITDAGINPLPVQRPIPVWMGGGADRGQWRSPASMKVLRRIARMADGWFPLWDPELKGADGVWAPNERSQELLALCRGFCREYGRDPATLAIEGRLDARRADESHWAESIKAWQDIGASHLCINTMGDGLKGVAQHLRRLEEFRPLLARAAGGRN